MKIKHLTFYVIVLSSFGLFAQKTFPPKEVRNGTLIKKTIPLREYALKQKERKFGLDEITIVPNFETEELSNHPNKKEMDNPLTEVMYRNVQQAFGGTHSYGLEQNFVGSTYSESGSFPPDPNGAVGPNYYVHAVNEIIKIFDKTGTLLMDPVSLGDFFGIVFNGGDPIVLYDQLADRWFISEIGASSNNVDGLMVGVSETNDPTGAYYVYQFNFDSNPDFPKFSVWHDAYYLTLNIQYTSDVVFALERDVMLAGGRSPKMIGFPLPDLITENGLLLSPAFANQLGTTYPPNAPGYVTYFQDDGWSAGTFDHLKVWEVNLDWANTGNSTISAPLEIPTSPFNTLFTPFYIGNIQQPGTSQKLSLQGGDISYGANYRSFADHNSWIITFNTNTDNNDTSGIRWIELRNDANNPWSLYQEGTYVPADGNSRFMGSAAMDAAGNIGLAFNIASRTHKMGIAYTGRFDGDPLGQMTVAETEIITGEGIQTISSRFGDYSHLTMDSDNFTFWHTAEYFATDNEWATRIASFSLSPGFTADVGITDIVQPANRIFTNAETVEVNIRNFGTAVQDNIPLELRVDGNLVASETFTGSIASHQTATYTFNQTIDLSIPGQTYTIEARTGLSGDELVTNDPFTKSVTDLFANDLGVTEILDPVSGPGLNNEVITATIKNFGADPQSNFNIQYVIDGGTPVDETFAGSLASEEEIAFSFSQTADLLAVGSYNITVSTTLPSDEDATNDVISELIENRFCQPSIDCTSGNGFKLFSIAEIDNPSECEGYADFTNLVANLAPGSTNVLTVKTSRGNQYVNVWIDYNDDSVFTPDEIVVNNYEIAPGQGAGSYTETMDLIVSSNATVGMHRMRAKTNYNAPVPLDPCEVTQYGETEDYTANIGALGVDDLAIRNSELMITSADNKNFEISLISKYDGLVYIILYNVLGQELKIKTLNRSEDSYNAKLDMENAPSGIYLIKLGGTNTTTYKTGRIIVK